MSPTCKKEAAGYLLKKYSISERRTCRVLDISRSTFRYKGKANEKNDHICSQLKILAKKKPRYGSPRLHALLLRKEYHISQRELKIIEQAINHNESPYFFWGVGARCNTVLLLNNMVSVKF